MTLRVTVWNEFRHEKQNELIGAIYPDGMHTAIANRLRKESDFEVRHRDAGRAGAWPDRRGAGE